MCGNHEVDWFSALDGAHRVLRRHRIPVRKANPLDDDDFVAMNERFARNLSRKSGSVDRKAVQDAINELDVPWDEISLDERQRIISRASVALGTVGVDVWRLVEADFIAHARVTVQQTKIAVGKQINFSVTPSFDLVDQSVVDNVMRSQGLYITNEYGAHAAAFSQQARTVVADGLAQGLRAEEITKDLAAAAQRVGIKRPRHYWRVASTAFTNRARTHTQLVNYKAAGIERYEFEAVMDERTTDICRALDGRIFAVQDGLQGFENVENDARWDSVKDHQPWVRSRKNKDDGTIEMFIKQRDGTEVPVGTVLESGVGRADDRGRFTRVMDNGTLAQFGLVTPPLHGLCRSVIVPLTT